jgi:hypothetical protein
MAVTAEKLKSLIEAEFASVSDGRVVAHIRGMLIEPYPLLRQWDYGEPGQLYPCWMVVKDERSGAEIAYCEQGFGPTCPWGLVSSGSGESQQSIGPDTSWFSTFMDAFFDSFAVVELPIWRVFRVTPDGTHTALSEESSWETTWSKVSDLRRSDPANRYDCDHSISYRG